MFSIFARFPAIRMQHGAALMLKAVILFTFLAAASAPSPLYGVYRAEWGFSAFTLTIVFSSYALALLLALLLFGALSDYLGRRPILLIALAIEIASIFLFVFAQSVVWLLAARIVQGLATGIAIGTLNAGLIDLHRERGAFVNSVAPLLGMAVGALGAAALVQFAPAPTTLVYVILLVMLVLELSAAFFLPETVQTRPGVLATIRIAMAIPTAARQTLWQVMPVNIALWALGGFYMSLGPTLARNVTGNSAPIVGGAFAATLVLFSAIAVVIVRTRPPRQVLQGGSSLLGLGLTITLLGIHLHAIMPLFGGTMIAGLGFGAAFNGSIRSLAPLAAPHERASLMSGFFALSYLAFSLPAIIAGVCVGIWGLQATALGYGMILIALTLLALLAMRSGAKAVSSVDQPLGGAAP
jgi:MFS family permease